MRVAVNVKGFQCCACGKTQAPGFHGYTCPACGGNLDVTYDYHAFQARMDPEQPFAAARHDIFKYAPLLPIEDTSLAPPLRVGATPLYPAERLGASAGLEQLYLKDDGLNPSGSFKDRASAVAIARARETGAKIVAGASTGNAGSSMACMAASVGLPCIVFVPEKAPPAKIAQLLVFGAKVMAVRGTYDDAFDLCLKICAKHDWFNRNTGHNPFTREGKKTVSYEICEQFGWNAPDWIVVPTGDGNILSGTWKGLKDLHALGLIERLPRLVCAQSEQSAAVSRAVWALRKGIGDPGQIDWSKVRIEPVRATTLADSISVDVPRDGLAAVRAVIESGGEAVTVPDTEILAAIPEIARGAGVFCEPSCAATWAVVKKLARERRIAPRERVVCLITGSGLKDIVSARKAAGEPTLIDPTVEAAEAALNL
ncbi:MAG: threonine synthase [Kiritimatiellae bacterium]|nr:threonine synthase [Kiritimatiellia bacterium]